eukprot:m.359598 g.359598  ORF g.359598 m.359598 type:complete len:776 (+) comp18646_c0_seq1:477-2804(+)
MSTSKQSQHMDYRVRVMSAEGQIFGKNGVFCVDASGGRIKGYLGIHDLKQSGVRLCWVPDTLLMEPDAPDTSEVENLVVEMFVHNIDKVTVQPQDVIFHKDTQVWECITLFPRSRSACPAALYGPIGTGETVAEYLAAAEPTVSLEATVQQPDSTCSGQHVFIFHPVAAQSQPQRTKPSMFKKKDATVTAHGYLECYPRCKQCRELQNLKQIRRHRSSQDSQGDWLSTSSVSKGTFWTRLTRWGRQVAGKPSPKAPLTDSELATLEQMQVQKYQQRLMVRVLVAWRMFNHRQKTSKQVIYPALMAVPIQPVPIHGAKLDGVFQRMARLSSRPQPDSGISGSPAVINPSLSSASISQGISSTQRQQVKAMLWHTEQSFADQHSAFVAFLLQHQLDCVVDGCIDSNFSVEVFNTVLRNPVPTAARAGAWRYLLGCERFDQTPEDRLAEREQRVAEYVDKVATVNALLSTPGFDLGRELDVIHFDALRSGVDVSAPFEDTHGGEPEASGNELPELETLGVLEGDCDCEGELNPGRDEDCDSTDAHGSAVSPDQKQVDGGETDSATEQSISQEFLVGVVERILKTYTVLHANEGYIQGMTDVLLPILEVLKDEVDAYFCFVNWLHQVSDRFTSGHDSRQQQLLYLHHILCLRDHDLVNQLQASDLDDLSFCFQWILIDFVRELDRQKSRRYLELVWAAHWTFTTQYSVLVSAIILLRKKPQLHGTMCDVMMQLVSVSSVFPDVDDVMALYQYLKDVCVKPQHAQPALSDVPHVSHRNDP